jgi:hypothetical protein
VPNACGNYYALCIDDLAGFKREAEPGSLAAYICNESLFQIRDESLLEGEAI